MTQRPNIPAPKPLGNLTFPSVASEELTNGLNCYWLPMGTQEVVRVDIVFWAGRPFEQHKLAGRATAAMLREGTRMHTAGAIAEHLDFYGAGLSIPYQTDTTNVALYCLSEHLPAVLPVFMDVLTEPAFHEQDLAAYVKRQQQELREDLTKNDVLAYRYITEAYYGDGHPYGYNSFPETYGALQADWLVDHHKNCYHAKNAFAVISGRWSAEQEKVLKAELSRLPGGKPALTVPALPRYRQRATIARYHNPLPLQSAIRIGRPLFNRHHEDAHAMYVLACALGGYFGSRLMTNIREDKGYTYHINAAYDGLAFDGAFQIDTEVGHEYLEATLVEISREIDRLQQDLIPSAELSMVRNYLKGTVLTMMDGPFNWAETVRTLLSERASLANLQALLETIENISSEELRTTAQQYLQQDDLWTIVVGNSTEKTGQ